VIVLDSVRRLLAAGKSPGVPADIRPPDLSHPLWVAGWPPIAHRWPGGGCMPCYKADIFDGGHEMSTDEIRRLHTTNRVEWCPEPACFPGRRCKVCGVPSGDQRECAACPTAAANRRAA
jgi:hypothetical protein